MPLSPRSKVYIHERRKTLSFFHLFWLPKHSHAALLSTNESYVMVLTRHCVQWLHLFWWHNRVDKRFAAEDLYNFREFFYPVLSLVLAGYHHWLLSQTVLSDLYSHRLNHYYGWTAVRIEVFLVMRTWWRDSITSTPLALTPAYNFCRRPE